MLTLAGKQDSVQHESSARHTRSNSFAPPARQQAHPLLHLQRTVGNRAVQRLLDASAERAVAVRAPAPLAIQAKLAVNAPGDVYEQEADHVAEQIMQTPAPQLQRACSCDEGCSKCPTQSAIEPSPRLQTKRVGPGGLGQVPAPPSVHAVLASPGQPLDAATRAFFEPRFGRDFSGVRVHSDAAAGESAREVNANAYTVGQSIAFGASRFAPVTADGRRLLAHELTHVAQQSGAQTVLQREMGFEFQVNSKNKLTTNKNKKFGVKSGRFFHRLPPGDKHGLELQTDTGSVLEFQTHHFQKWSDLRAQIQDAVDVVNDINKDPKAFPFNQAARLEKEGLLTKGETLEVTIADPTFKAAIQSTEAVALSQYESLLKEHEQTPDKYINPVLDDVQNILHAASKASKSVKTGVKLENLRGFLQMLINYVRRGQTVLWGKTRAEPVKATFSLMARTDFSSAFRDLLTPDEKTLFKEILKTNAIPNAVGISANDPFFATGYWGHMGDLYAFFEGGKVTALAPEDKRPIHDCSKKGKTPGVDSSHCGKKVPDSLITVGGWLDSIVKQNQDELSPPSHGSSSMGKFPVASKGPEKGLVVVEARGYRTRIRSQPASKWVDFAEDLFSEAAACRARPGAGTELNYDGTKAFDPKKCP